MTKIIINIYLMTKIKLAVQKTLYENEIYF